MVAHHFSMYREIAQTLEETAMKQLASLGDCFPGRRSCLVRPNYFAINRKEMAPFLKAEDMEARPIETIDSALTCV